MGAAPSPRSPTLAGEGTPMRIKCHLPEALSMSLLTALLTLPVLGVHLQVEGLKVALQGDARPVCIAMAAVFLARLFQEPLKRAGAPLCQDSCRLTVIGCVGRAEAGTAHL